MRKEKEIKNKKEVKLNLNYIDFIKDLYNSKMEINKNNKEKIENKYSEIVNLKFSNIERVSRRVKRKENKEKLNSVLKELNLSENNFLEIDKKLNIISKERKNNYI